MSAEPVEQLDTEQELPRGPRAAYDMHVRGETYRSIAAKLDVSVSTAHAWVQSAARAIEYRTGGHAVEIARDNARLNAWYARVEAAYETGEDMDRLVTAARTAVQILARRSGLLGLDAPRRLAVQNDDQPPARPDAALLEELRRVTAHEADMAEHEADDGLMDP